MTIIRPPVTGDPQLDSWAHSVTDTILRDSSTVSELVDSNAAGTNDSVNAVTLILYKRYESETLPLSEYIQTTLKYTYKTSSLDITNPDGWSREYPDVNQGRVVFAIQVNIADTNEVELIPASAWSEPILISKVEDVIGVRIATNNGTALRGQTLDNTTLKAVVTRNGSDESDLDHNGYHYKWTIPSGEVVCVDASRNIINSGEAPLVATGTEGSLVCTLGTPASNTEPLDIHGSTLRQVTIGSEDVDKTQLIQLEVTNIP